MRKAIIAFIILSLLLIPISLADSVTVKKIVQNNKNLTTDEPITITLEFNNPFSVELAIKVKDRNVFGNNGYNIECMEQSIVAGESKANYEAIPAYTPGKFTIDPVEITYINPETGEEETVKSEEVKIVIKGEQKGQIDAVTYVYQCNGINRQSTQMSTSSSSGQQEQQQQSQEQQDELQQKLQNSQQQQDMGALKQEMQNQEQAQQQMADEFGRQIQQNPEFQEMHQNLIEQGYAPTDINVNPESEDTGQFEYDYTKQTEQGEESASLTGNMQNGEMQNIDLKTTEELKQLMQKLEQSPEFQEIAQKFEKKELQQSQPTYNNLENNKQQLEVPYQDKTEEEKARIQAVFENGELKEIMVAEKGKRPLWFWLMILLLALLTAYLVYSRRKSNNEAEKKQEEPESEPIDYKKIVSEMIAEAKQLFLKKKEKEAYAMVSTAVRFYYLHKLETGKELSRDDCLKVLRQKKLNAELKLVGECLDLCDLVKFAKYKPHTKDFSRIVELAEKIVD